MTSPRFRREADRFLWSGRGLSSQGRLRWALCVLALAGSLVGVWATPVSAHASLLSASPVAEQVLESRPSEVRLTFSEPVDSRIGGVDVLGPDGDAVDIDRVNEADGARTLIVPIDAAAQGTHTVAWRVVSADGHTIAGSYVFHVIARSGGATMPLRADDASNRATLVTEWLGRFLAFGGVLVLIGSLWVVGPSGDHLGRVSRMCGVAGMAAFVGSAMLLWSRGADAGGSAWWSAAPSVKALVGDTWAGAVDAVRVVLGFAAVVARRRVSWRLPLAAISTAMLMTFPLAGHAWSTEPRVVAVLADAVHLSAAAIWVGGVVTLLLLLSSRSADRGAAGPTPADPAGHEPIVDVLGGAQRIETTDLKDVVRDASRRFLVAAPVVVVTGVVSTLIHISSIGDLAATTWGRAVLAKVVLTIVALGLGAVHRRRLHTWVAGGLSRLVTLRAEAVAFVAIVSVTAGLVVAVPAEVELDRPFWERQRTETGFVQLAVSPARGGSNDVHLAFLTDTFGDRSVDALRVEIQSGEIPERVVPVTLDGSSHASGSGISFGAPGSWRVIVRTVYRGVTERVVFNVELR